MLQFSKPNIYGQAKASAMKPQYKKYLSKLLVKVMDNNARGEALQPSRSCPFFTSVVIHHLRSQVHNIDTMGAKKHSFLQTKILPQKTSIFCAGE